MNVKTLLKAAIAAAFISAIGFIAAPSIAQVYPFVAGDVTRTLGNSPVFPFGVTGAQMNQQSAGQFAERVHLVAGVVTFVFPAKQIAPNGQAQATAYNSVPVCTVTEESTTTSHTASGVPTTAQVVVTSVTTASNTDFVDIVCVGNPN